MQSINDLKTVDLSNELWAYLRANPTSLTKLAIEIGTTRSTVNSILADPNRKRSLDLRVMLLVRNFLDSKKKE